MSYTIEDLTTIDDAIFDTLWLDSFPRIESGATMPWASYDVINDRPLSDYEKKETIKHIFTMALESGPDSKLYLCRKDGTPIRMFNASVFDSVAVCHYTLYGPDADGSRSWLYDGEVLRQTRDQLTSDFDVTGHTIHVATGSPMHTYYLSRGNEREHSVSETQGNDGISIITFTYTGE
jgi:hypothetical protein